MKYSCLVLQNILQNIKYVLTFMFKVARPIYTDLSMAVNLMTGDLMVLDGITIQSCICLEEIQE